MSLSAPEALITSRWTLALGPSLDNFSDLPYFDNFDGFEVFFFKIYWVCSCFTMLCKPLQYTDKVSHTL